MSFPCVGLQELSLCRASTRISTKSARVAYHSLFCMSFLVLPSYSAIQIPIPIPCYAIPILVCAASAAPSSLHHATQRHDDCSLLPHSPSPPFPMASSRLRSIQATMDFFKSILAELDPPQISPIDLNRSLPTGGAGARTCQIHLLQRRRVGLR